MSPTDSVETLKITVEALKGLTARAEMTQFNNNHQRFCLKLVDANKLVGWCLTALSTQFRSYHAFKVELFYKY